AAGHPDVSRLCLHDALPIFRAAATAADGWVVSEEVQPDAGRDVFEGFAMIVVSVPSAQLDATLEKLGPTGRLTSRNITSLDVTQDFKDSNVRIATLEASITRVRGLLADATDIEDIVFLERELASREAELDVLKAHVMGLEADVERSTITVQLSETDPAEPVTVVEEDEPIGFAAGLAAGWKAFLGGVAFLLTALGALLPFAIVAAIVLLPVLWWRRRRTQFDRPARPSVTTAEWGSDPLAEPGDVGCLARYTAGRLHHRGCARGTDHLGDGVPGDGPGPQVGVPVGAGVERVPRVVGVHQVDPTGDRPHPVHHVGQLDAPGVGVARVEAEADGVPALGPADRLPQPVQCLQPPRHGVVAARSVLDEQRDGHVQPVDALAPVVEALGGVLVGPEVSAVHDDTPRADLGRGGDVLLQQLASRDPDPVVGRRDVDRVGSVHIQRHSGRLGGGFQAGRPPGILNDRPLVALRVAEEELDRVGAARLRLGDGIALTDVCSD